MIASGSQYGKQLFLAGELGPSLFSGWSIAVLMSQLLFNLGGLGFHNFSASKAAIFEARCKPRLLNRLVFQQYAIYGYCLPISLPFIYFLSGAQDLGLFYYSIFYALSNVVLNATTNPIYVQSSLEFAKIQMLRGILASASAYISIKFNGSLNFAILFESLTIVCLAFYCFKSRKYKPRMKYFVLKIQPKVLFPFFLPVILTTFAVTLSRIFATTILIDPNLGIFFFFYTISSMGSMIQYGLAVLLGPILTSNINLLSYNQQLVSIIKLWLFLLALGAIVSVFAYYALQLLVPIMYPEYVLGLSLSYAVTVLAVFKACEIWPIYFLLTGQEKYLSISGLLIILAQSVCYVYYLQSPGSELAFMSQLLFAEAGALFITPFLFLLRKSFTLRSNRI
jgi:hypothetical protein